MKTPTTPPTSPLKGKSVLDICAGKHQSFAGRQVSNASHLLRRFPFLGGHDSCQILQQRELTTWMIAHMDLNPTEAAKVDLKHDVHGDFLKALHVAARTNSALFKSPDVNPNTIAKLVAGLMDNEERLKFVFANINELREASGGIPLDPATLKAKLSDPVIQELAGDVARDVLKLQTVGLVGQAHKDAQDSLVLSLAKAMASNAIFEVVLVASEILASYFLAQGFLLMLVSGAIAGLAAQFTVPALQGLANGLEQRDIFKIVPEIKKSLSDAFNQHANDPDSIHPITDNIIISACLGGLIKAYFSHVQVYKNAFPGLMAFFYPCMNVMFTLKGAIHRGQFDTALAGSVLRAAATGYARGLLRICKLDPWAAKHVPDAFVSTVTVPISGAAEQLFNDWLVPSLTPAAKPAAPAVDKGKKDD